MPGIKFAIEKKYLKNRIWKKKKMADNLAWGECARKKEEKKRRFYKVLERKHESCLGK